MQWLREPKYALMFPTLTAPCPEVENACFQANPEQVPAFGEPEFSMPQSSDP
jgi:hypothetical protein